MAINITGKFKPQGSFALVDAVDVELPDGSRLSDYQAVKSVNGVAPDENGNVTLTLDFEDNPTVDAPGGENAGIPQFDLQEMGMAAISLPVGTVSLAVDTTEMISALAEGAVRFAIPVSVDGNEAVFHLDMHGFTDGSGSYQCISLAMMETALIVLVNLAPGGLEVSVMPVTTAIGIPAITAEDNDKILKVVDGAWTPVEMDGLAGGVSSWNNLTDKPFYEEGSRVLLIEETKFEGFTQNPDYGLYFAYDAKPFSLAAGETYTVLWDGGEYVVTALDASAVVGGEMIAMGDGSAWGLPGNEEPFIIATDAVSMYFFASDPNDSAVSHDVGIYQGATVIKTLDEKYLPMDAIDQRIEEYISSALEGDY